LEVLAVAVTNDMVIDHLVQITRVLADDATMRSHAHRFARPHAVKERNKLGQEASETKYAYGLRWMIAYVFSAIKRTLGDSVRSRDCDPYELEENRFWTWNK
jgi:hypothetical protein